MAAIEFAKKIFDWRTRFHARRVLGFINATSTERNEKARALGAAEGSPAESVLTELLQLGTGVGASESSDKAKLLVAQAGRIPLFHAGRRDPAYAMFALELERMMGAMQEAGRCPGL